MCIPFWEKFLCKHSTVVTYQTWTSNSSYYHSTLSTTLHFPPRMVRQLSWVHLLKVTFLLWRDWWQQGPSLTWRQRYCYFIGGGEWYNQQNPLYRLICKHWSHPVCDVSTSKKCSSLTVDSPLHTHICNIRDQTTLLGQAQRREDVIMW